MFYLQLIYSIPKLNLPDKKRTLFSKKLEMFYKDTEPKRDKINDEEKMRIQTDLQFQQNEIKRLNKNIILKCLAEILEVEKHL